MVHLVVEAPTESQTNRLGGMLAEALPPGSTVALCGTLGAGKTRLAQAVAEAFGVPRDEVSSPTFVLIKEYAGRRSIYHFDAYRVQDDDEFLELGPDEYFESDGIVLIEWADRVRACLPREYLSVSIEVTGEYSRRFTFEAVGPRYEPVVTRLAALLPQCGLFIPPQGPLPSSCRLHGE